MSNDQCKNIPVELILATTDPNLYDTKNKKWLWDGQMYWAVECLAHHQRTVSDRIVPNIDPARYQTLDNTPASWNFCHSINCNTNSEAMQIIFTFNPRSKDPNDYLQYVIDIPCHVTDKPQHDIKDNSGTKFYIDIIEISKMTSMPYVEIWIAKTHEDKELTIDAIENSYSPINKQKSSTGIVWLIVLLMTLLFISLIVGGVVYYRSTESSSNIRTIGASNIY